MSSSTIVVTFWKSLRSPEPPTMVFLPKGWSLGTVRYLASEPYEPVWEHGHTSVAIILYHISSCEGRSLSPP